MGLLLPLTANPFPYKLFLNLEEQAGRTGLLGTLTMLRLPSLALTAALTLLPQVALAAEFDGASLGFAWALPFVGILLSIALFPLLAPHFWEHHQGKIAALWGLGRRIAGLRLPTELTP